MSSTWFVAINAGASHITSYPLGDHSGEVVVWHGENYPDFVVEGCIFEVEVTKDWTFGNTHFISGPILSQRIDIPALGLLPLAVRERIPKSNEYEMEQVIPGWEPNFFGSDPIINAVEYKNKGDYVQAWDLLRKILKEDLRCVDAYVHLGNFCFGEGVNRYTTRIALKHYSVAVAMGNFFLGANFKGKLPWGWINNRPYLRALHGQCICFWALEEFKDATKVARYILKLNPMDNQGIRFLIPELKVKKPYGESNL
jgi:hypothetical protein